MAHMRSPACQTRRFASSELFPSTRCGPADGKRITSARERARSVGARYVADDREEIGRTERLFDDAVRDAVDVLATLGRERAAREEDDARGLLWAHLFQALVHLHPADVGHHQVRQD